jgi:hypothetical protein
VKIEWNDFRREEGSLDLCKAYEFIYKKTSPLIVIYLKNIEEIKRVHSTQLAAAVIETAHMLFSAGVYQKFNGNN